MKLISAMRKLCRLKGSARASFWVLVALGIGTGCVTPPKETPGFVRGTELEDFPYPASFHHVESYQYYPEGIEASAFGRSWRGIYHGPQTGGLAAWFVKNMSDHGWVYKGMRSMPGDEGQILRFEKGDEEATVRITREVDFKLAGYKSVVTGSVHPRGLESYPVGEPGPVSPPAREQQSPETIQPAGYQPASGATESGGPGETEANAENMEGDNAENRG
jgi:hypothetical protein